MDSIAQPLIDCLQKYPNIRRVLGSAWIEGQADIDPLDSDYALARWLRHPGYEDELTTLDSLIHRLSSRQHFRERKNRIRSDSPGLMETLAEVYFCAWIESVGYQVEMTSSGADFMIKLDDGSSLLAEVTTPRRATWTIEVFEIVDLLSKRYKVSAHINFVRETLPASISSNTAVTEVKIDAVKLLSDPKIATNWKAGESVIQTHPELGLEIKWSWPDEAPRTRATSSPDQVSDWAAFEIVVDAAQQKSRQLPTDHAGLLVIGTRQMPQLLWLSFTLSLKHYPIEDIPFDWSRLPENIKHVLFYTYSLSQIRPWEQPILMSNHSNPLPDPSGFKEFSAKLQPTPFRTDGEF